MIRLLIMMLLVLLIRLGMVNIFSIGMNISVVLVVMFGSESGKVIC